MNIFVITQKNLKKLMFSLALFLGLLWLPLITMGNSFPEGFSFSCTPIQPMEEKPGEPAKFSNLGFIQVRAVLIAPVDIIIERFSLDKPDSTLRGPNSHPMNPRNKNLYITVNSQIRTKKKLDIKIRGSGGGQSSLHKEGQSWYKYSGNYYIDIPVPAEIMEKETMDFVELIQPALIKRAREKNQNMTEKELENYLRGYEKEFMKENFQRLYRKHQTGSYEIRCKYSTQSEGAWKGTLEAEPFIIEVKDDGGFWDKEIKKLKKELEQKKTQEKKKNN